MAEASKFDELALQYVLTDEGNDPNEPLAIAKQAAQVIEQANNKRAIVALWTSSISRWMQSQGDENPLQRAKALDFLASTLQILAADANVLKLDQIRVLVIFFGSLFENDHKAGIMASTKALRHLVSMNNFEPTLGITIVEQVCKLKDDFKLQAPATRLRIYHLIKDLTSDHKVKSSMDMHEHRWELVLGLVSLCRFERDPECLILWFGILKSILQDHPPADVVQQTFSAFSAYFPISLRPSGIPTAVTTEDLKTALRECFSADRCLANLSIPFLIEKLDQLNQTMAVKTDILSTLRHCIVCYNHSDSVAPHADRIWNALKYEVRNGDGDDSIKLAYENLGLLSAHLHGSHMQSFFDNVWGELSYDIADPSHTVQAGDILAVLIHKNPEAFAHVVPTFVEHIKRTIKDSTSVAHKAHLIRIVSAVVKVRFFLLSSGRVDPDTTYFCEDLFGDSLFSELYLPLWEEHSSADAPLEYTDVLREAAEGLWALVGQMSRGGTHLCSGSTCEKILHMLAKPVIYNPICRRKYLNSPVVLQAPQHFASAAVAALQMVVCLYPPAMGLLLFQFLECVKDTNRAKGDRKDALCPQLGPYVNLVNVTRPHERLSDVVSVNVHDQCWLNQAALINALLQGIQLLLLVKDTHRTIEFLLIAINLAMGVGLEQTVHDENPQLTKELFDSWVNRFNRLDVPQIDLNRLGTIDAFRLDQEHMESLQGQERRKDRPRRIFLLFVVQQLVRRTLDFETMDGGRAASSIRGLFVQRVSKLATPVIGALGKDEQVALQLDREALNLFRPGNIDSNITDEDGSTGPNDQLLPRKVTELVSAYFNQARSGHGPLYDLIPLSLSIMKGLWPEAINSRFNVHVTKHLLDDLTFNPANYSKWTREAMDTLVCVLGNKLILRGNDAAARDRRFTQNSCLAMLETHLGGGLPRDDEKKLLVFKSIMSYLAGDMSRLITPSGYNTRLLHVLVANGPVDPLVGRRIASSFGLLSLLPKCLSPEFHAVRHPLCLSWLYHAAVQPYLRLCIAINNAGERLATNRCVATFAILQHMKYEHYESDIEQIVRIAIHSLTKLKVGIEAEALLKVIFEILEHAPGQLREHLTNLVEGVRNIYEMARNVADTVVFKKQALIDAGGLKNYQTKSMKNPEDRDPVQTRIWTLLIFQQLTKVGYEPHLIVPFRINVMRSLTAACGDPVREIRTQAIDSRRSWTALEEEE